MVALRRTRPRRHPSHARTGIGAVLLVAVALPATAALEAHADLLRPTPVVAGITERLGAPGRAPAERLQRTAEALHLALVFP
jgi:hypothetical protein